MNSRKITTSITKTIEHLKDTRYATKDTKERLVLAQMEVARLRGELCEAKDAKSVDKYAKLLKAAQKEYMRLVRLSRKRA